jgi:hypothetical protein
MSEIPFKRGCGPGFNLTPEEEAILSRIAALPPERQRRLACAMDDLHTLEGYAVISLWTFKLSQMFMHALGEEHQTATQCAKKLEAEVRRRGEGPRARRARVEKRNCIIDGLWDQQMTDPKQILAHLVEHEPELVYKSKPKPGKPATFILPEMMMLAYERWKRTRNNCNHSE